MSECTNEELESLRSEARRFLQNVAPIASVREQFDSASGFDEGVWARMGTEMGLSGLHLPEIYGGQELGYRVAAAISEEMGRVLLQAPYLSNAFSAALILAGCTDSEKVELLPGLASGERIISVAVVEDEANSWRPESVRMNISSDGETATLRGTKSFLMAASRADLLLVVVREGDGLAVTAVDPRDARVVLHPLECLDLTRPMWRADFNDAPVRRLGKSTDWSSALRDALNRAIVLLAAEMVGGAQACLEAAVAYTKERHQFGRPIGSFQALKHKAADIVVEVELARAAVQHAAAILDTCAPGDLSDAALTAAATAKLQADAAYRRSSLEGLHMHGGIGFTWEQDSHLYVRRAQASIALLTSTAQSEATLGHHIEQLSRTSSQPEKSASVAPAGGADLTGFANETYAWLEQNAKPLLLEDIPPISVIREVTDEADLEEFRAWCRLKQAGNVAGLHWPTQYGGQGLTFQHQLLWNKLVQDFDAPEDTCIVGAAMAGPIILRSGNDAQRELYLPKILSGEHIWCQLFSEPGAGSDLAGIQTRGTRTEEGWLISGQKVWTSVAQFADWGLLLARTDPTAPKHKGITCFVLDMKSPGIEVRPIRQMNHGSGFNEVFMDEVLLPHSAVIGTINDGWRVALETLNEERKLLGGRDGVNFYKLVNLARNVTIEGQPAIDLYRNRAALTALFVRLEALRALNAQARADVAADSPPDVRLPVAKLVTSSVMNEAGRLALDMQGSAGALAGTDAIEDGIWQLAFLGAPARRIAGGTDEVQRNIIAERFLQMPVEPRVDKGKPFSGREA